MSSWTERTLTHESDWYPKRSMRAAERIAFYATRFPLVEIETTYRFPPTPDLSRQWVDRTPDGFTIDIQAWSLLTEQPTIPGSLWEDLHDDVRTDLSDRRRLYASHLSDDGMDEAWRRFVHAVHPLHDAGRLGTIVLRYPRWFVPRDENRELLVRTRERLGDLPASVELSCADWVEPSGCEATFSLLEDLHLGFVCVDAAPGDPRGLDRMAATTTDLAVLRLRGRRSFDETSSSGGGGGDSWTPDWRSYRYDRDEIDDVSRKVRHLASSATSTHVLVSTCWRDDAVRNAQDLAASLGSVIDITD